MGGSNAEDQTSERALLARVNRHLAGRGEQVRRTRAGSSGRISHGCYYRVFLTNSEVLERRIDLAELARKECVAAPYERRRAKLVSHETDRFAKAVDDEVANQQEVHLEEEVPPIIERWLNRQILVGISADERAVVQRLIDDLRSSYANTW
jgi:hypothetical protein